MRHLLLIAVALALGLSVSRSPGCAAGSLIVCWPRLRPCSPSGRRVSTSRGPTSSRCAPSLACRLCWSSTTGVRCAQRNSGRIAEPSCADCCANTSWARRPSKSRNASGRRFSPRHARESSVSRLVELTFATTPEVSITIEILSPEGRGPFPVLFTQTNHRRWGLIGTLARIHGVHLSGRGHRRPVGQVPSRVSRVRLGSSAAPCLDSQPRAGLRAHVARGRSAACGDHRPLAQREAVADRGRHGRTIHRGDLQQFGRGRGRSLPLRQRAGLR